MGLTRPRYSQIYDTDYKQSVDLATTGSDIGNLTLGNLQPNTLDSVSVTQGMRILVKDQTRGLENGIYYVNTVGSGSNGWWYRALDADNLSDGKVTSGMLTSVSVGNINAGKQFRLTTSDPISLGNTSLTFTAITSLAAGANTYVQFYDLGGVLGGTSGLTFNKTTNLLTVGGNVIVGNIVAPSADLTLNTAGSGVIKHNVANSITWLMSGPSSTVARLMAGGQATLEARLSVPNWLNVQTGSSADFTNEGSVQFRVSHTASAVNRIDVTGAATGGSPVLSVQSSTDGNINLTLSAKGSGNITTANSVVISNTTTSTSTTTGALTVAGGVGVGGNLYVGGNLIINGTTTTINSNSLSVNDSIIYLADENPADTLDIGISSQVINPTLNYVGFVRDATDGIWKLFSNVATQPDTTVDFTSARYANLQVGNLVASSIVISGTIDSSSSGACTIGGLTLASGTIFRNGAEMIIYGGGQSATRSLIRLGNSQGMVLYGRGTANAPSVPNNGIIIHGGDGNVQIRAPNVASGGSRIQLQAELVEVQGNLTPVGNLLYSIGNVTNQWNTVYAANIAAGNVTVQSNLSVAGNLIAQSNLSVAGNVVAANYTYPSGESVGFRYTLDDIGTRFDGVTKTFLLSYNDGTVAVPTNPNQLQITIGGVPVTPTRNIYDYQNLPEIAVFNRGFYLQTGSVAANATIITGNSVSAGGNTIVFATAPSAGMDFYGTVQNNSDKLPAFTFKQSPFKAINIMLGP